MQSEASVARLTFDAPGRSGGVQYSGNVDSRRNGMNETRFVIGVLVVWAVVQFGWCDEGFAQSKAVEQKKDLVWGLTDAVHRIFPVLALMPTAIRDPSCSSAHNRKIEFPQTTGEPWPVAGRRVFHWKFLEVHLTGI